MDIAPVRKSVVTLAMATASKKRKIDSKEFQYTSSPYIHFPKLSTSPETSDRITDQHPSRADELRNTNGDIARSDVDQEGEEIENSRQPDQTERSETSPVTESEMERSRSSCRRMLPPQAEIDEFFAVVEKDERKRFLEKYNYDIAKDIPLEGRFEWVRVKPALRRRG